MAFEYIIDYLLENRLLVSTLGKPLSIRICNADALSNSIYNALI